MASVIVKKLKAFNPHGGKKKHHAPKKAHGAKKKRNPPTLLTLGLVNPERKERTMNTKKKAAGTKKKNPFGFTKKKKAAPAKPHTHKNKSKNPQGRGILKAPLDGLKAGAVALAGLVTARQLPQLALGPKNESWMGYGANLLTSIATGYAVGLVAGKEYGTIFSIGGALYTVSRVLGEQLSPVGKYFSLAGLGDATAVGSLGVIQDGYFPLPVITDRNGNPMIPNAMVKAAVQASMDQVAMQRALAPPPVAAPAAMSGMRGVPSRFSRR